MYLHVTINLDANRAIQEGAARGRRRLSMMYCSHLLREVVATTLVPPVMLYQVTVSHIQSQ